MHPVEAGRQESKREYHSSHLPLCQRRAPFLVISPSLTFWFSWTTDTLLEHLGHGHELQDAAAKATVEAVVARVAGLADGMTNPDGTTGEMTGEITETEVSLTLHLDLHQLF